MSEEVTYATLTFQDSVGERNNRDRNNLRKRGRSSDTARWDLGECTGDKCFGSDAKERYAVESPKWRQSCGIH